LGDGVSQRIIASKAAAMRNLARVYSLRTTWLSTQWP